jgi:hypothetical protein
MAAVAPLSLANGQLFTEHDFFGCHSMMTTCLFSFKTTVSVSILAIRRLPQTQNNVVKCCGTANLPVKIGNL